MALTYIVGVPPQIPADGTANATLLKQHVLGAITHTETLTIPKITPKGVNGSCTIVNGAITAYTAPT